MSFLPKEESEEGLGADRDSAIEIPSACAKQGLDSSFGLWYRMIRFMCLRWPAMNKADVLF